MVKSNSQSLQFASGSQKTITCSGFHGAGGRFNDLDPVEKPDPVAGVIRDLALEPPPKEGERRFLSGGG